MPFSNAIKKEVKRRGHYQCCICRVPFLIEVHHILPEEHGGEDVIENAAPLCSNCHFGFGDNPKKRAAITEVRNWWYEVCERSEKSASYSDVSEKLDEHYASIKEDQEKLLIELKGELSSYFAKQGVQILKADTMDDLVTTISGSTVASIPDKIITSKTCRECGRGTSGDGAYCTFCGSKY